MEKVFSEVAINIGSRLVEEYQKSKRRIGLWSAQGQPIKTMYPSVTLYISRRIVNSVGRNLTYSVSSRWNIEFADEDDWYASSIGFRRVDGSGNTLRPQTCAADNESK